MFRIISALILAVTATSAFAQEKLQLVDNPPDRHIVVQGDTLWGIAGEFMKEPWRWPEIWRLNKEQVKNPHLIYPGDIIVLDTSGGSPRLSIAKPLKVEPQIYSSEIKKEISTIPQNVIEPFIAKPLVVEAHELDNAPRIAAVQEGRIFLGNGDTAYVSGIPDSSIEKWSVYRPGKAINDPDTKKVIGYEAFELGTVRLIKPGTPATIRVITPREEMGRGDRLLPTPLPTLVTYAPHAPERKIAGRIAAIYGGVGEGGRHSVIVLNRGIRDGLEVGHVVALYRKSISEDYDDRNRRVKIALPDEKYGLALVFRTFKNVSYALVMESSKPIIVGDAIYNP